MREIYFDNAATSRPKRKGVSDAMKYYLDELCCNAGRGAYSGALRTGRVILETRERLCRIFDSGTGSENVFFTMNVTQALNTVMKGIIGKGDHFLISGLEHNAVARPAFELKKRGADFDIIPCTKDGKLEIEMIEDMIRPETKALIMTHGSNVCGSVLPAEEAGQICRKHGVYFVLDTAQTAGLFDIDMKAWGIDALCFTGHKSLRGPLGIGGSILSDRMKGKVSPLIEGGTGSVSDSLEMPDFMPDMFEAGTQNIPGIFGLNETLKYIEENGAEEETEKEKALTDMFIAGLSGTTGIRIAAGPDPAKRCPVVSLDFTDADNASVAAELDNGYGILTRVGMHCAPLAHKTLGTFPQGTVRFSFGPENTEEEIQQAIKAVKEIYHD